MREEHNEALNSTKENDTTEAIEETDNLRQTLEEKIWYLQFIFLMILALYQHMYQV